MGCGTELIRFLVLGANLVFSLAGIGLLTAGILIKTNTSGILDKLNEDFGQGDQFDVDSINTFPILTIVLGSVIFLISFLGCCGVFQRSPCMLNTYATIVLLIFILQAILGILVFVMLRGETLEDAVRDSITPMFEHYSNSDPKYKYAKNSTDYIQRELECCGIDKSSFWNNNIPDSCKDDSGKIYQTGCVTAVSDYLRSKSKIIGIVALVLALIELLGGIFACSLSSTIRNESRRGIA